MFFTKCFKVYYIIFKTHTHTHTHTRTNTHTHTHTHTERGIAICYRSIYMHQTGSPTHFQKIRWQLRRWHVHSSLITFNKSFLIFRINFHFFIPNCNQTIWGKIHGMVNLVDLIGARWGGVWESKDQWIMFKACGLTERVHQKVFNSLSWNLYGIMHFICVNIKIKYPISSFLCLL
jgi:hypothetical protein